MIDFPLRQWISLESTSLFELIKQCTIKSSTVNKRPFHRLCSLMRKMGAQSLWIEEVIHNNDAETSYEIDYLRKFYNSTLKIKAFKLIFVYENTSDINKKDPEKLTFLSCSVVINYSSNREKNSYLLYSIVTIPKKHNFLKERPMPLMNYYFHSFKEYSNLYINDPSIGKVNFKICGAPFFQQNNTTSFCMQTALATVFNNISPQRNLILPNHINELYGTQFGRELILMES